MTVINNIPQEPTDLVIQGENMRAAAMASPMLLAFALILTGAQEPSWTALVAGEQTYPPMNFMSATQDVLINPVLGTLVGDNSAICNSCGAIISHEIGNHLMNSFTQSAQQFLISGVTRDSVGAILGTCRVILWREINYISETVSDASGNYSFVPSGNQAHQITAYKSGAPDRAGISIQNVIPAANG